MTKQDFLAEIKLLEAAYPPRQRDDPEVVMDRRKAMWDVVGAFSHEVFRKARIAVQSTERFFPTPSDLYAACLEADRPAVVQATPRPLPPLPAHQCVRVARCEAYTMLLGLTNFGVVGYEALHVGCPVDHATCPKCAACHAAENPLIVDLKRQFPEQTVDWRPNFKGWLLCSNCTKE